MTSETAISDEIESQSIIVYLRSPFFNTEPRITFTDLPLSTTVLQLKAKITLELPNRPPPESQHLFYKAKLLGDDDERLRHIFKEPSGSPLPVFLILGPLPGNHTHLTSQFGELSSAYELPQHTNVQSNEFRHQVLDGCENKLSGGPSAGRSNSPVTADASCDKNHQAQVCSHPEMAKVTTRNPVRRLNPTTHMYGRTNQSSPALCGPGSSATSHLFPRSHGSLPRVSSSLSVNESHNQPAPNALDEDQRSGKTPANITKSFENDGHLRGRQRTYDTKSSRQIEPEDSEAKSRRLVGTAALLMRMETKLRHGFAPGIREISEARTALNELLEDQRQNRLCNTRSISITECIARLSSITSRANQLRLASAAHAHAIRVAQGQISLHQPYLLMSPSGCEGVLLPRTAFLSEAFERVAPVHAPPPTLPLAALGAPRLNGELALDPALLNRHPLQHPHIRNTVILHRNSILFKVIRSAWLFIRLYFFCYILSDSGSWLRVILVTFAVFWAFLSETDIPQQIQRSFFTPLRQHLEGLLPTHPEHPPPPRRRNTNDERGIAPGLTADMQRTNQQGPNQNENIYTQIWRRNRAIERAVTIFLASFVPGVSERQIAAMNAANAARENAERARREQENLAAHPDTEAAAGEDPNRQGAHHNEEGRPQQM